MERAPEPPPEHEEVVERHVISERRTVPETRARDTTWTLWLIPLLLLVIALVWYALSRGQPQSLDVPDVELPAAEAPRTEQRIEIETADPTEEVSPPADAGSPPPEG